MNSTRLPATDPRCPCGEDAPHEGETCTECGRLLTPDGYLTAHEQWELEQERLEVQAECGHEYWYEDEDYDGTRYRVCEDCDLRTDVRDIEREEP